MKGLLTKDYFYDAEKAREYLEKMRWSNGVVCPHCGSFEPYKLEAKEGSKNLVRNRVHKCKSSESNLQLPLAQYLKIATLL